MGSLLLAEAEVGTEKPDYAEGHKDEAREGGQNGGSRQAGVFKPKGHSAWPQGRPVLSGRGHHR